MSISSPELWVSHDNGGRGNWQSLIAEEKDKASNGTGTEHCFDLHMFINFAGRYKVEILANGTPV